MKVCSVILVTIISIASYGQPSKMENGKLVLDDVVIFKTGSAELSDEGKNALKPVKEFLIQKDYITTLRVEGHADNTTAESTNQALTEQRALSVCKWLVENGIGGGIVAGDPCN